MNSDSQVAASNIENECFNMMKPDGSDGTILSFSQSSIHSFDVFDSNIPSRTSEEIQANGYPIVDYKTKLENGISETPETDKLRCTKSTTRTPRTPRKEVKKTSLMDQLEILMNNSSSDMSKVTLSKSPRRKTKKTATPIDEVKGLAIDSRELDNTYNETSSQTNSPRHSKDAICKSNAVQDVLKVSRSPTRKQKECTMPNETSERNKCSIDMQNNYHGDDLECSERSRSSRRSKIRTTETNNNGTMECDGEQPSASPRRSITVATNRLPFRMEAVMSPKKTPDGFANNSQKISIDDDELKSSVSNGVFENDENWPTSFPFDTERDPLVATFADFDAEQISIGTESSFQNEDTPLLLQCSSRSESPVKRLLSDDLLDRMNRSSLSDIEKSGIGVERSVKKAIRKAKESLDRAKIVAKQSDCIECKNTILDDVNDSELPVVENVQDSTVKVEPSHDNNKVDAALLTQQGETDLELTSCTDEYNDMIQNRSNKNSLLDNLTANQVRNDSLILRETENLVPNHQDEGMDEYIEEEIVDEEDAEITRMNSSMHLSMVAAEMDEGMAKVWAKFDNQFKLQVQQCNIEISAKEVNAVTNDVTLDIALQETLSSELSILEQSKDINVKENLEPNSIDKEEKDMPASTCGATKAADPNCSLTTTNNDATENFIGNNDNNMLAHEEDSPVVALILQQQNEMVCHAPTDLYDNNTKLNGTSNELLNKNSENDLKIKTASHGSTDSISTNENDSSTAKSNAIDARNIEETIPIELNDERLSTLVRLLLVDAWSHDLVVVKSCLTALKNMCATDETAVIEMFQHGGHLVVIVMMRKYFMESVDVQITAISTLQKAAECRNEFTEQIIALGALELIIAVMKQHSNNEELVTVGCGALLNLTLPAKHAKVFVFELQGIQAIASVCTNFPRHVALQKYVLKMIQYFSYWDDFRIQIVQQGGMQLLAKMIESFLSIMTENENNDNMCEGIHAKTSIETILKSARATMKRLL